jgi:hypothetical protein
MSVEEYQWYYLWEFIHVICKCYIPSPENADAIKCIFYCISDLIPHKEARYHLKNFLKQYNIDEYLSCSNKMFEYSYKLHNYINIILKKKNIITLEQAFEKFNNISKDRWGNCYWYCMHYFCANLNDILTNSQKLSFKSFMICLVYLIPCSTCKNHYKEYLSKNNIDKYLNTNYNIYLYTFQLHNIVNAKLNKEIVDFNSSYNFYKLPKYGYELIDTNF